MCWLSAGCSGCSDCHKLSHHGHQLCLSSHHLLHHGFSVVVTLVVVVVVARVTTGRHLWFKQ